MTKKFKLYALELSLILVLFFALFALNIEKRLIVMIILIVFTTLSHFFIDKKGDKSINEKHVSILMLIISFIYLGLYYLLGLYYGFIKSKYSFSINSIIKIIIPIAIIIVLSEILRKKFLSQKSIINVKEKKYDLSPTFVQVAMVLVDLVIYTGIYNLANLDDFLVILGFILFASFSHNLLYNYMSNRFGYKPIIIFRLITNLYVYIIPYIPDVYIFMRTFLRMSSPFIIYLILEQTYSKSFHKERRKNIVGTTISLVCVALVIMLVSCQFRYGIIVIGSDSMTGTINKGDAVIFQKYNGELIDEGQVIIFEYNNIKTVHRVVNRESINGEIRYTTKGDSNKTNDGGYRRVEDIKGLVKLKIKYIGRPTLWFRSLFGQ